MKKLLRSKLAPTLAALFAALLFTAGTTSAQQQATIVFVNTQELLKAHPDAQAALDLEAQAKQELQSIADQIKPLNDKRAAGQTLTEQERNQLNLLQRTLQETQKRYTDDYNKLIAPIQKDIDAAIAAVAKENGYTIVLNRAVAATSGLVVYAQESLDITQQVVARIKAQ